MLTKRDLSVSPSDLSLPNANEIHEEDPDLPQEMNQHVLNQMEFFLGRGRDQMERYLERSTRFLGLVKQTLKEEGVPEDLAYVALIESGFNSTARSHAKAVGYWQFIRGTGERYGLKVNSLVDERRDPIKSTVAAARYLKSLYNLFGSWHLAFAAYNVGENRVKYQVMKHQTRDLWELIRLGGLPAETKQYVPKFIAARMIAKHPEKYGFKNLQFEKPITFETVKVEHPISLSHVAHTLGISNSELKSRNPMFRTDLVPVNGAGVAEIRVPVEKADSALIAMTKSKVNPRHLAAAEAIDPDFVMYKVKRGDTLASIAYHFGTKISQIRSLNKFGRKSTIVAGVKIKVPPGKIRVIKFNPPKTIHVVKRGDTLIHISKKYGVALADIKKKNKLSSHSTLVAGAKLLIPN
jgi:membrane-bound lytic murein transglycosylase D